MSFWSNRRAACALAVLTVTVAACAPSPAAPTTDLDAGRDEVVGSREAGGSAEAAGAAEPAKCPQPLKGTVLLENTADGYCLLYPEGYQELHPVAGETVLAVGGLLDVTEPRAYIRVEAADGRTADDAASDILGSFPDSPIRRSEIRLGGEPAALLEGVPGQDPSREVLAVSRGRLYRLSFVPVGADYGELAARTDQLYFTVVELFRFQETDED